MSSLASITQLTFIRWETVVRTMNSTTVAVLGIDVVSLEIDHDTGSVLARRHVSLPFCSTTLLHNYLTSLHFPPFYVSCRVAVSKWCVWALHEANANRRLDSARSKRKPTLKYQNLTSSTACVRLKSVANFNSCLTSRRRNCC